MMKHISSLPLLAAITIATASSAFAAETIKLERLDAENVLIVREGNERLSFWLSQDTILDSQDTLIAKDSKASKFKAKMPAHKRAYIIAQNTDGHTTVVGERVLPLEQSSNFRDLGGYTTKDGKTVRWGKAYRSGAMPVLTEADYSYLAGLGIDTIVDFRALEEREIAPDLLDDKLGLLFISNDYSIKPLLEKYIAGERENVYSGIEETIAPQLRSMFKRLLADDGAVVYHCSAGQDRTGVATALIYDVLGIDRDTILKDYHLSTDLRRVEYEMPPVNPADYPNNIVAKFYLPKEGQGPNKAEPLYTPSGQSQLAQFFVYLDNQYGGSAGYLKEYLGFTDADLDKLRAIMLVS